MNIIRCASVLFDKSEREYLLKTMNPFWLSSGKWVREFESGLSKFLDAKFCVACNSGSSANLLAVSALMSLGVSAGDEIITTALCFPTTVSPIVQNGLIPVFVDVNRKMTIDIGKMKKAITSKTKAIIVAHTLGIPSDMGAIMDIAKKYKFWVIEDNCDALGSKWGGKYTGTIGDMGTLSFYPAHHITTGEGGMVITNKPEISKVIKSLRDWGRDCHCETGQDNSCGKRHKMQFGALPQGYDHKYVFTRLGYNLKMTDLQAAIGCAQLKKLPRILKLRHRNWELIVGRKLSDSIAPFGALFYSNKRQEIIKTFEDNGIQTRMVFAGNITKQPMMNGVKYRIVGDLKRTDYIMNNAFWVGCHPNLTKVQITKMRGFLEYESSRLYY